MAGAAFDCSCFFLLRDMMKHHIALIEYIIYNIWYFEAGLVMILHIPQNLRIRSEGTERHSALN